MCGSQGASGSGCDDSYGKTTAEMQTLNTFTEAGWDFVETWRVCDGLSYPKLLWQILLGDFVCPDGVNFIDFAVLAKQWRLERLSWDVEPAGGDGITNFLDWAVFADGWGDTTDIDDIFDFAEQWLGFGAWCGDIAPEPDGDGIVDWLDVAAFGEHWLAGVE